MRENFHEISQLIRIQQKFIMNDWFCNQKWKTSSKSRPPMNVCTDDTID